MERQGEHGPHSIDEGNILHEVLGTKLCYNYRREMDIQIGDKVILGLNK